MMSAIIEFMSEMVDKFDDWVLNKHIWLQRIRFFHSSDSAGLPLGRATHKYRRFSMTNEDRITLAILSFIMITGLLFLLASFAGLSIIPVAQERSPILAGVSLVFIAASAFLFFRFSKGKLKSDINSLSVEEIRIEAIKKIKTASFLAKMIKEESNNNVRKAAIERLKELEGSPGGLFTRKK